MSKKNTIIAIAICFAGLLSSCTKTGSTGPAGATGAAGPTGPTGATGPAYTAAISGHVSLYDQYGSKILTGLSNVAISLNDSAAIAPDATGFYIFPGLVTGQYYINTSAIGYGATKADNFQLLSDTLNKDIKLSVIPTFSPVGFTEYATLGSVTGDSLVINFTPDTRARECIVFLNSTSMVNSQPANYLLYYAKAINPGQSRIQITVPAQDLYDAGFASGQTVYYAAYGHVVSDVSVYEDLTTGRNVFNAVSASSLAVGGITP